MADALVIGQRVRIWVTGMIPRYTAEVVQVDPVRLRPLDVPDWPAQLLLKNGDYVILADAVNAHIDAHGDAHVLRTGPLAGKILTYAATDRVTRFAPEIARILDALGYPEALVTDESSLADFCLDAGERSIAQAELPVAFASDDELLVDIAERMRGVS